MKLVEERNSVKTNIKSEEFKIDNSSFMFSILSKKLYSDPYLAVLRELSCNAYDAHIENGCENKPFDIKIPDYYDNEFYIRDYGPGMSPDKISEVYTVLGRSDKRDGNNVIGCFGLGSKTPYAITDSFTVESWHNGKYYLYSMHMNENNIPSYSLISENDSTKPSGLKITINVDSDKTHLFYNKCDFFRFFNVKPNFIGKVKPVIHEPEILLSGDKWKLYKGSGSVLKIVMGQIPYNLNNNSIYHQVPDNLKPILNCGGEYYFDIGEISITPSRESLELNSRTVLHIINRLQEVSEKLEENAQKEIDSCTNLWEARLKAIDIKNNPLFSNTKLEYNGKKITEYVDLRKFNITYAYGTKINDIRIHNSTKFYVKDCSDPYERLRYNNLAYYVCDFKDDKEKKEFCELLGFDESYLHSIDVLPKKEKAPRKKTYKVSKFDETYSVWKEEEDIDLTAGGYYVCTYRYQSYYGRFQFRNGIVKSIISFLNDNKVVVGNVYGVKKAYEKTLKRKGNWLNLVDEFLKIVQVKEKNSYIISTGNVEYLINDNNIKKLPSKSKIVEIFNEKSKIKKGDEYEKINHICSSLNIKFKAQIRDIYEELKQELKKYPLIDFCYCNLNDHAIKYIEAVDKKLI